MSSFFNKNFIKNWWRGVDQQTMLTVFVLFLFGAILVTTSSSFVASRIGLHEYYFASRQIIYLVVAGVMVCFFSSFTTKTIKRIAIIGFLFNVIMLVMVKLLGYEVKGATRWISLFGFSYQPSEFIKPFFAIVVGWVMSLRSYENFPSLRVCFALYMIVASLLIMQPDFGMLVVITTIFAIQIFVAGLPIIWIFMSFIASMCGIVLAYFLLPHVASRINNYLDPVTNENYQVSKSILAFEHGGLYGKGPGEGAVKQYLPDSHTDFIFAVAGEEFGALICLIIIGLFAFIVLRTLLRLLNEEDKFIQISVIGVIAQFGIQAIINMGVTLHLLPTKGMTLPFISYGGSSTLAMSIGFGMMLGMTKRKTSANRYKMRDIIL